MEASPLGQPGQLDPDVAGALDRVRLTGRVLDIGTGTGAEAIELARRGLSVVGTDLSASAIVTARERATAAGLSIEFRQDDILATKLEGGFDAVLDRGCFDVLEPAAQPVYARTIARLLQPAGWLFLKVHSFMHEANDGPHRFTRAEICQVFEPSFEIVAIADTVFQGLPEPQPKALFCVLRRNR